MKVCSLEWRGQTSKSIQEDGLYDLVGKSLTNQVGQYIVTVLGPWVVMHFGARVLIEVKCMYARLYRPLSMHG